MLKVKNIKKFILIYLIKKKKYNAYQTYCKINVHVNLLLI